MRLHLLSALPRIRHIFRMAAGLGYAGWWWFVLTLVGVIVWPLALVIPTRRRRWEVVRLAARSALRLMGTPIALAGKDHLSYSAQVIVINHASYVDVFVLAAVLPGEPTFVAKRELASQKIAGPLPRLHYPKIVLDGGYAVSVFSG